MRKERTIGYKSNGEWKEKTLTAPEGTPPKDGTQYWVTGYSTPFVWGTLMGEHDWLRNGHVFLRQSDAEEMNTWLSSCRAGEA